MASWRLPVTRFLAAVTIPAVAVAALFSLMPLTGGAADFALTAFALAFVTAWVTIAVAGLLLGLPVTFLLAKFEWESGWSYALAGLILGMGAGLLFSSNPYSTPYVGILLLCGLPGAICGFVWWMLFRRQQARTGGVK